MQLNVALIGQSDAGTADVFNAIVGPHVIEDSHARVPRRTGTLQLPDERLEQLASAVGSQSVVHAKFTLWEYPGLGIELGVEPDSASVGDLRNADILVLVVRVGATDDRVRAIRDTTAELATELAIRDVEVVEGALARARERVDHGPRVERRDAEHTVELLTRLGDVVGQSMVLDGNTLTSIERRELSGFALFALKPRAVVVNVPDVHAQAMQQVTGPINCCDVIAGRMESELWDLEADEAQDFRDDLGLYSTAGARISGAIMEAAALQVFYTANRSAATSWLLPVGGTALDAARTVHSDFAERFIRADVARADEVIAAGGLAPLRDAGRLRSAGRNQEVGDRDLLHIHFSR